MHRLNSKLLKDCSDNELLAAWQDTVNTPHDLADAIIAEVDIRRLMRAQSPYHEPRDAFPI